MLEQKKSLGGGSQGEMNEIQEQVALRKIGEIDD